MMLAANKDCVNWNQVVARVVSAANLALAGQLSAFRTPTYLAS
jgi:hypothetical protein